MRAIIIDEEIYLPEPVGKQPKYWIIAYDKRLMVLPYTMTFPSVSQKISLL